MRTRTVSPLVLSTTITLGQGGNVLADTPKAALDLDRLRNRGGGPFLLDEIRCTLQDTDYAGASVFQSGFGHAIRVRLDLGRLPLTQGFVPLALLGYPLDFAAMPDWQGNSLSGSNFIYAAPSGFPAVYNSPFVWRLPKPLYIPKGETVIPQFYFDSSIGFTNPAQVIIEISYVGRMVASDDPPPKSVCVPWVTPWIDSVRAAGSDYLSIRSNRSDLKNPFAETLYVQRLQGSYLHLDSAVNKPTPAIRPMGTNIAISALTSDGADGDRIGHDFVFTRLIKSNGRIVVRDPTPWAHLFNNRVFDVCGVLERNQFYQLSSDIRLASFSATDKLWLMASMIGYRKVAYDGGFVEAP